jgi:sulfur carrier protein ThiS adenylyltransferase
MYEKNEELRVAMAARNSVGIQEKLRNGKIAVAGLGGLGSNIAVMLARIGVGKLLLVDFDKVEPSNLNRQYFNITHLGMFKTEALQSQLELINPFVETEIRTVKITEDNAAEVVEGYEIVCEAFDRAQNKAIIVNALLEAGGKKVVAASGMNGFASSNKIKTRQAFKNLYICGDSKAPEQEGIGFMAPRVGICAGHQANMALRLLLGIESTDEE